MNQTELEDKIQENQKLQAINQKLSRHILFLHNVLKLISSCESELVKECEQALIPSLEEILSMTRGKEKP